jgi:Ca2+/Na+ antiporter
LSRGGGVITGLAGVGMAFLAGQSRTGDARFRRAAVALSLAIVVLMPLVVMFGVVHVLTLLGVLLLIAGTVLITRPGVSSSSDQGESQ